MPPDPARKPTQLPLDLALEPQWGEEDFLVGPSNEAACALIEAGPGWPGGTALITGPAASGKTHLAKIHAARTGAAFVPPEALTIADAPRLAATGAVIDGGVEDRIDEQALFHLLNLAGEHGTGLLILSRRMPADWPVTLPDLASRLRRAPLAEITPPDETLIRMLLVKLLVDRQLRVDTGLVDYAAIRLERSFAAARRFVAVLDHLSLANARRPTRGLAAEVLERMASDHA
jgi:chromosomal replication initiation ATPase DnaA